MAFSPAAPAAAANRRLCRCRSRPATTAATWSAPSIEIFEYFSPAWRKDRHQNYLNQYQTIKRDMAATFRHIKKVYAGKEALSLQWWTNIKSPALHWNRCTCKFLQFYLNNKSLTLGYILVILPAYSENRYIAELLITDNPQSIKIIHRKSISQYSSPSHSIVLLYEFSFSCPLRLSSDPPGSSKRLQWHCCFEYTISAWGLLFFRGRIRRYASTGELFVKWYAKSSQSRLWNVRRWTNFLLN